MSQENSFLLIWRNPEELSGAIERLKAAGLNCRLSPDRGKAPNALKEEKFRAVFLPAADDAEEDRAFLHEMAQVQPHSQIIWLIDRRLDKIEDIFSRAPQKSRLNFISTNPRTLEKEISATACKLDQTDIFGLRHYMDRSTSGADIRIMPIQNSGVKQLALYEVLNYVRGRKINPRFHHRIEEICDELLTNAIYDAPTDPQGEHIYMHLPRTQPVRLRNHKGVILSYCYEGDFFYISVSDPFGSLAPEDVTTYLDWSFKSHGYQMDMPGKGGAGLGFFKIYQSINSLVFNIQENVKTEAIAIIRLDSSFREWKSQAPSLHIFFRKAASPGRNAGA